MILKGIHTSSVVLNVQELVMNQIQEVEMSHFLSVDINFNPHENLHYHRSAQYAKINDVIQSNLTASEIRKILELV